MTNAELIDLLREARESLDSYQSDDHTADANTWWGRRWEKAQAVMSRIDAALAAHAAEEADEQFQIPTPISECARHSVQICKSCNGTEKVS